MFFAGGRRKNELRRGWTLRRKSPRSGAISQGTKQRWILV